MWQTNGVTKDYIFKDYEKSNINVDMLCNLDVCLSVHRCICIEKKTD